MLPFVRPVQDVRIIKLLGRTSCGKRPHVPGHLVEPVKDGTLLVPHLWNSCDLWLHAEQLIHDGIDAARKCKDVEIPSHKARGGTLRVLIPVGRHLPRRSPSGLSGPGTRAAAQGAPCIGLEVAIPDGIWTV